MNVSHLASSKEALCAIVDRTGAVCEKYTGSNAAVAEAATKFRRVYEERIGDLNPTIMIYGIYNAGKSTLLNALVGQDIAEMNDVPTTVKVTPYKWNEFTIYDTPGINAPKKDEEVSKAQLEKTDVIIFVMDTEGQFNAAKNYREMVGVVNDRKRLLIVLNNKSGIDMQSEDGIRQLEVIKGSIYRDFATEFRSASSADDLAKKFKIIVVDAKVALEARTETGLSQADRQLLLASSNIEALEDAIREEYSKASGFTVLEQLGHLLSNEFSTLETLLSGMTTDTMSQKGLDAHGDLARQQEGLTAKITDFIHDRIPGLKDGIIGIVNEGKSEDEAKAALEKLAGEFAGRVNEYFRSEVGNISTRIDATVNDFVKLALPDDIGKVIPAEISPTVEYASTPYQPQQSRKDALLETTATYAIAKPLLNQGVKALLPVVAKLPIIGPILTPTLPVLGPVLIAIAAFKCLFGGDDRNAMEEQMAQHRERMEAQIAQQEALARHRQECIEESGRMAKKIGFGLIDVYTGRVGQLFEPLYEEIRSAMEKASAETASIMADLNLIEQAQRELNDLARRWGGLVVG